MPNDLVEKYTYKGDGELFMDISSKKPLKKKSNKQEETIQVVIENNKPEKQISNKEIYNSFILENKPFTIKLQGNLIFDSDINKLNDLIFYDDYFLLNKKQFQYNGINIKLK